MDTLGLLDSGITIGNRSGVESHSSSIPSPEAIGSVARVIWWSRLSIDVMESGSLLFLGILRGPLIQESFHETFSLHCTGRIVLVGPRDRRVFRFNPGDGSRGEPHSDGRDVQ